MSDADPGVAIVGCGLIGKKRAQALGAARLVACADVVPAQAEALARTVPAASASGDWRTILERPDVDIVVVAASNDALAQITLQCVEAGKHVLVEKPAARKAEDLLPIIESVNRAKVQVRVGFNHRYHPALRKARELYEAGCLGNLMFLRGRYGHGGRLGYEREWRSDPVISGGGELIDQGVHLIDLARWFMGEFTDVEGFAHTFFWEMPVDDNGFMLLKTAERQVAFLHVSCTEWKNLFSFEIYGRNAKLAIDGLGGSYGLERIAYYRMLPEMGPPETTIWEYPMTDTSWQVEFADFLEDIRLKRKPSAGLDDAYAALRVVEKVYQMSGYDF